MHTSAERDIVVLSAREQSHPRDVALADAISKAPDWRRVFDLASQHGTIPYLAATARRAPWSESVPAGVAERLDLHAASIALKNDALFSALANVLAAFAQAGVQPVVLKGPALAQTVYPHPGWRPFRDLDLLCRSEDLSVADLALRSLAYEPRPRKPTEQDQFHAVYSLPGRGVTIELHSDLLQLGLPTRCGTDLWRQLQPFSVGGVAARMLGVELQILHLCVHLHTHGYSRLIWFKDLDLLLRRFGETVDWRRVASLAAGEGVALSVRHALRLTQLLLATPLPPYALRGMAWNPLGEVAHATLWPRRHILDLQSKQRLRSLRFNPRLGVLGVIPSLVVMGRRGEKLSRLIRGEPRAKHSPDR